METTTVRWLLEHDVIVNNRLIHQHDTFEMPRAEAEAREDVAIVESESKPAAALKREGR